MRYQIAGLVALGVAQTFRGAINGTVTDPTGGVVPRAEVVAENTATEIEHTTVATSDGQFVFQDLPLGTYEVTVTVSRFAVFTADNVAVTAGAVYALPVRLTLVQAATTVRVSAATLALDTTMETQTMTVAGASLQDGAQQTFLQRQNTPLVGIGLFREISIQTVQNGTAVPNVLSDHVRLTGKELTAFVLTSGEDEI